MRIVHDSGAAEEREWHEPPAPQAPPAQTQGDAGWFWLRLFTPTERARWNLILKHAESLTPAQLVADSWLLQIVSANRDIERARLISLDNASVIAGVQGLCRHAYDLGGGLIITVLDSDDRVAEVLAGEIVA